MAYRVVPFDPAWLLDFVNGHARTPRREAGDDGRDPVLRPSSSGLHRYVGGMTVGDRMRFADMLYEALRASAASDVAARYDQLLRDVVVRVRATGDDGGFRLAMETEDVQAVVVLAAASTLECLFHGDGPRARLGVCSAERCADLYVDRSQAATRRYCSRTCQNRTKVAAYRARRRAVQEGH